VGHRPLVLLADAGELRYKRPTTRILIAPAKSALFSDFALLENERKGRLESLMIRAQAGVFSRAGRGMGTPPQAPIRDSKEIMWPANHTRSPVFNAVDRAIATDQTNQLDR
jgi:hypothetical protein